MIPMPGSEFGSYTVIGTSFVSGRRRLAPCRCRCGRDVVVQVANLISGHSTRCRSCASTATNRIHGETRGGRGSAEYRVWAQMIGRCHTTTHKRFADYGGRGIVVCERWRHSLANFIEDMGRRPSPDHQIERENNGGNYESGNCRWATRKEQGRNKRNNVSLSFEGRTQPMSAWAEECGLPYTTLRRRIKALRWPVERALTMPIDARRRAT